MIIVIRKKVKNDKNKNKKLRFKRRRWRKGESEKYDDKLFLRGFLLRCFGEASGNGSERVSHSRGVCRKDLTSWIWKELIYVIDVISTTLGGSSAKDTLYRWTRVATSESRGCRRDYSEGSHQAARVSRDLSDCHGQNQHFEAQIFAQILRILRVSPHGVFTARELVQM